MLRRIVIENYRSCLKTRLDLHPNLSVLIGPNGSGKTNILQAVLFLNKLTQEEGIRPSLGNATAISSRLKSLFSQDGAQIQLNATINAVTDDSNNDVMIGSRQKWHFKSRNGKKATLDVPLAFSHLASGHHLRDLRPNVFVSYRGRYITYRDALRHRDLRSAVGREAFRSRCSIL